jgi:hypothetical protein
MQPENVNPESTVTSAPAPTSQSTWPGAFGLYKHSKAAIKFNIGPVLILLVLTVVASGLPNLFQSGSATSSLVQLLASVLSVILSIATIVVVLGGARRTTVSLGESFSHVTPMLVLRLIGASIVTGVLVFLSIIALVIPFFFVFPRLLLVSYFIVDGKMGVFDAVSASWNKSKGNVGKVYGIIGANVAYALLAITIIGIPFSIYFLIMYSAAMALLYQFIVGETLAPVETTESASPAQKVQ